MSRSQNGHHSPGGPFGTSPLSSIRAVRAAPPLPLSVVIPTLDEARNIGHVLALMPPVEELIIVDGCSEDDTVEVVRRHRPDARIILQRPEGKGSAMRAGFEIATAPYVVAMDADGSMDPRELPAYVALFELGYDVVKGSRSAVGGGSTDLTLLRKAGNRGLVGLYNAMFRTRLSDLCYGFIGFRRDRLDVLGLYAPGFEIEAQIIAHAQLLGLRMAEVPSQEADRLHGESNLQTWKDGRRVLRAMLRTRFQPGRELWRHRASDLPAHHSPAAAVREPADDHAARDLAAALDPGLPTQRQVPGPRVQP